MLWHCWGGGEESLADGDGGKGLSAYALCTVISIVFKPFLIIFISRIILVFYCKCCNLIGYSTRYLFLDR